MMCENKCAKGVLEKYKIEEAKKGAYKGRGEQQAWRIAR